MAKSFCLRLPLSQLTSAKVHLPDVIDARRLGKSSGRPDARKHHLRSARTTCRRVVFEGQLEGDIAVAEAAGAFALLTQARQFINVRLAAPSRCLAVSRRFYFYLNF